MICIQFLVHPEGDLLGFEIRGHSGYAEAGSDIVCAAVSSAAYLTANTVMDVLHVSPVQLRVEEGNMLFRIAEKDGPVCRDVLTGLKLHCLQLEEQYSEYLQVAYSEVYDLRLKRRDSHAEG